MAILDAITVIPEQHNRLISPTEVRLKLERKTRLELATPTLARLCSTN